MELSVIHCIMWDVSWGLVAILAVSGIIMGLVSCLIGMRPKVENPAWWVLYGIWIAVVLGTDNPAPFFTILISSILAGLLHGITSGLLIDKYVEKNPWHADRMAGPKGKIAAMFIATGLGAGTVMGAFVGGIAWGLSRL